MAAISSPSEGIFGPCMVVNRRKKSQERKNMNSTTKVTNGFDKLAGLEEINEENSQKSAPVPGIDGNYLLTPQITMDVDDPKKQLMNPFGSDLKDSGWDYLFVLLKKHNLDLVLLVESHLDDVNSALCIRRFGDLWDGDYVPGNGRSDGIILVWKRNLYKMSDPWLLTGLYASDCKEERLLLWELLSNINSEDSPWLVVDDFNCITSQEEKKGGLIDLKFKGLPYTWCNNRKGKHRILARLDKAFANFGWINMYSCTSVYHLERISSDHNPILVSFSSNTGLRPEFKSIVAETWNKYNWKEVPVKKLGVCLKEVSGKLSTWSKINIGSIEKSLNQTLEKISNLEEIDAEGKCNEDDLIKLNLLNNKASALNRQIHIKAWSKSRYKWLHQNDKNTKKIHCLTKMRKKANEVTELDVNEGIITDPIDIVNAFAD
ncbi:hypothetical protein Cni_G22797 [Canna indica]|uniref:Uncharacterized protein n=1 Tax=Canna indica TaxID=4628 RepID=A0AAQ3KUU9_9LILI|nr:hypothetical protein Cni_G22797 [Canna indica]